MKTTTIEINDISFQVTYKYHPADVEVGDDAEVEIFYIKIEDDDLTDLLKQSIIEDIEKEIYKLYNLY